MTEAGEIFVSLDGKDVGLSTLLQKVDQQTQKSADNAARLQAQYARLAAAQGNTSQSTRILSSALTNNGGASERTVVSLSTQLATVQRGTTYFQEFGAAAKGSLLGIVDPASAASAAVGVLISVGQSFKDAFTFKAQLDATTASIKSQLDGFKDASRVYSEATEFGRRYAITQQETNAILASSTDIMRTTKASVGELETALIRLQSRDVSKPISEASRALRELQAGDVTSIKELFNVPAKDALRMRNEIVAGGDAVQVLTAWLDQAQVGMGALEQRTQGAMGKINELKVANEDLALAQAKFAQGPGLAILGEQIAVVSGTTRVLTGDTQAMGQSLLQAEASGSLWVQLLAGMATGSTATSGALQDLAQWVLLLQGYQQGGAVATDQNTQATVQLGAAMDAERSAVSALASEHEKQTAALIDQITKKQATAQASSQLTQIETILANIGNAVAAGQTTAANGAIAFANAAGIATSQAYALVTAQAALSNAKPPATAGQIRVSGANAYQSEIDRIIKSNAEAAAGAKDYRDAQLTLARAHKDTAKEVALLRSQQQGLNKYSNEYARIEAQIISAQESGKKAKGGGGGAGAVKLSDQQRLNNQLLTSQETYENKYEDLEADHAERRLAILKKYNEDVAKEQANFAQSQLDTAASFYDQLGGIQTKKAGAIQKQASVEYEQAVTEAAQMGGEAGQRYLEAKEAAILARSKRAEAIQQAVEGKDTERAKYLRGVDAKYRAAEDAKIAAIKAGGDAAVNERDKQLADEDAKYEESSGKISVAADRAADAKIAASERAGKAIDAEQAKLAGLETTYNRMGRGPSPAAAPTATAAGEGARAPTAAAAGGLDVGALLGKLDELRSAIVSATSGGADRIVRSVDKIGRRGGVEA